MPVPMPVRAGVTILGLVVCTFLPGGCGTSAAECPASLLAPPGARNVRCDTGEGGPELSYTVAEAPPAAATLDFIRQGLRQQGWIPLEEDFLNPGVLSSHVTGWRRAVEGDSSVERWYAQWKNERSDVVGYDLRHDRPAGAEGTRPTTTVTAFFTPLSTLRQTLTAAELERLTAAKVCRIREPDLRRTETPECPGSAPQPVPLVTGALFDLALLRTASLDAESSASGNRAALIRDGWRSSCEYWAPPGPDAQVTLDLGRLYEISGVSIFGSSDARSATSTITLRAAYRSGEFETVSSSAVTDWKGGRVFSLGKRTARWIQIRFQGADFVGLRVDEIVVLGNCIQ